MVNTASSCQISSKWLEPRPRYGDFSIFTRWRPSAILDLWCVCSDHPLYIRAYDGLYHCAKFGWNRCSSFDNMHVFWFREFGLKTPIHAPKLFYGGWPLNGEPCKIVNTSLKRHILARVRVVWAIMRENPSTGLTCKWVLKKKAQIKIILVIFHPCAQKPPVDGYAPNLAHL